MPGTLHQKLQQYIRSYYLREWIKSIFLFLFLFSVLWLTLIFLEWLLWLKPAYKWILYYFGMFVSVFFFLRYVLFPFLQFLGWFRTLNEYSVAVEIGRKIPGIQDSLINYLELENLSVRDRNLLEKELQRREKVLSVYDFSKVINFEKYYKYVYLLFIPLTVLSVLKITEKQSDFETSYLRLRAYNREFQKPAPYSIRFLTDLKAPEDSVFTLRVAVHGDVLPSGLFIGFAGENHAMIKLSDTLFEYPFGLIQKPLEFYLTDKVFSFGPYSIQVLHKPVITQYKLHVQIPSYLKNFYKDSVYKQAYVNVPQGSRINIAYQTAYADSVRITPDSISSQNNNLYFRAYEPVHIVLQLSDKKTRMQESFHFQVDVIPDNPPEMSVRFSLDTTDLHHKNIHLLHATDDYGLTRLYLIYTTGQDNIRHQILLKNINNARYQSAYIFPYDFNLPDTLSYSYFFRVYDNRGFHGYQKADSPIFTYNPALKGKKDLEKTQENLLRQWQAQSRKTKNSARELEKTRETFQKQKNTGWQQIRQTEELIKNTRKQDEEALQMLRKTEQLLRMYEKDKHADKQELEQLKKRLEELKKLLARQKKEKELEELLKKMEKEKMLEKLKELENENRLKKQSLDRMLELTKQFFIKQSLKQMGDQLKKLARKQDSLARNTQGDNLTAQKKISRQTEALSRKMDSLAKMNKTLKEPMQIPQMKPGFKAARMFQKQAEQQLQEGKKAAGSQKKAAQELKQMAMQLMQMMMSGSMQQNEEDIENIKVLINNLLEVSFHQEKLLQWDYTNPGLYTRMLLEQNKINKTLTSVSDSLLAIANRQPALSQQIFEHLNEARYQADQSVFSLQDKQFHHAQIQQRIVLQEVNELVYLLNLFLDTKQQASMAKGSGGKPSEMQLPNLIKKRAKKLSDKMQQMIKSGKMKTGRGERMGKEAYQLYKEHQQLKDMLSRLNEGKPSKKIKELNNKLEELSKKLLKEGIRPELISELLRLDYELLKLVNSVYKQHEENRRISRSSFEHYKIPDSVRLRLIRQYMPMYEQLFYPPVQLNKTYEEKYMRYKKQVK